MHSTVLVIKLVSQLCIHLSILHFVMLGLELCKPVSPFPTSSHWVLRVECTRGRTRGRRREKGLVPFTCCSWFQFLDSFHTPSPSLITPAEKYQHHWMAPPSQKSESLLRGRWALGGTSSKLLKLQPDGAALPSQRSLAQPPPNAQIPRAPTSALCSPSQRDTS